MFFIVKNIFIFTLILKANFLYAKEKKEEAAVEKCFSTISQSAPTALENMITDCKFQKEMAKDPSVVKDHQLKIYDKLSSELALQMKQNSEELSLLTTFYSLNQKDLLMNNSGASSSCQLEKINQIEQCKGYSKKSPLINEKMAMLKSKLPKNEYTPFKDDQSLYGIMAGKFYYDLGIKNQNQALECPLKAESGIFILQGQLDDLSAENILKTLSNNASTDEAVFDKYAQLKFIKDSKDPQFVNEFIQYIKDPTNGTDAKARISNFFFDTKNHLKLASTLEKKCDDMNKKIETFLCNDLTQLASMDDKTSKILFNQLGTNKPIEKQPRHKNTKDPLVIVAYGMQCLANEKKAAHELDLAAEQNVDDWYLKFTSNLRPEAEQSDSIDTILKFCSHYTCESAEAKKQKSCISGGPLSSQDLASYSECLKKPRTTKCSAEVLKYIAYLESLEKLKNDSKDSINNVTNLTTSSESSMVNNTTSSSSTSPSRSGRLPSFAENYFGAEGSLRALGKPVTVATIADKKQDIEVRTVSTGRSSLSPSAPQNSQPQPPIEQKPVVAITPDPTPRTTEPSQSTPSIQPEFKPTRASETVSAVRPKIAAVDEKNYTITASAKDDMSESTALRNQMEQLIAQMKNDNAGTSINENDSSPTSEANSSGVPTANKLKPLSTGTNKAEEARLKEWERRNRLKEEALEQDRRDLQARELAIKYAGSPEERQIVPKDKQGAYNNAQRDVATASASGTGAQSPTLTASSGAKAKADGKTAAGTAIIQAGKESSYLSTEDLSNLSPEDLKKLKIDSSKPFTLKVNFQGTYYDIPVKSFINKGTYVLVPALDDKNKELRKFIIQSPLFKEYREYMIEKEYAKK